MSLLRKDIKSADLEEWCRTVLIPKRIDMNKILKSLNRRIELILVKHNIAKRIDRQGDYGEWRELRWKGATHDAHRFRSLIRKRDLAKQST